MKPALLSLGLGCLLATGCDTTEAKSPDDETSSSESEPVLPGLTLLGNQGFYSVSIEEMATADDGLNMPRDLAFDPEVDGLLWVVNMRDDSVVHLFNAGTTEQSIDKVIDPYAVHFMDNVSSIDFGQPGTFGTCQESRNTYNGTAPPNYFMGPSLWPSDLDLFGTSNPEAVEYLSNLYGYPVDLGSHLDMLHESPLCMGIAWEYDNVYWVVDGYHGAVVRYDFVEDHGIGYDDPSDGIIDMHIEGELAYESGVPAHLEIAPGTRWLYVADPLNARVLRLDMDSGTKGSRLPVNEPGTTYHAWDDTTWEVFLDGAVAGFDMVSGLEFVGDTLIVSDNTSGEIIAFDPDGTEVDRISTGLGPGAIMGMAVRSDTELWFTDAVEDKVYRLTPDR
ncbi:MAG: hypothetical protein CL927_20385 [Deltaproteobacteria bacterium]|nr:hypothetical protein [Deltaproteobacteria bacterium]